MESLRKGTPIFVPSKGRWETSKTLKKWGHEITACFVEPAEIDQYRAAFPEINFVSIGFNNRGIAFVRNFILEYAMDFHLTHYWMLDDDVSAIKNGKTKETYSALRPVLDGVLRDLSAEGPWGQLALEYQQFAWATERHAEGTYCDVVVCVNVIAAAQAGIRYRDYVDGKEDRDFTMQLIASGRTSRRHRDVCFVAPKNGSNKGGLSDWYQGGERERRCTERMIQLWGPEVCQLNIKKDGRPDCKIAWRKIRPSPLPGSLPA